MLSMSQLTPALPEIVLACTCMALLMLGVFRGDSSTRSVSWIAVLALGGCWCCPDISSKRPHGCVWRTVCRR